MSVSAVHFPSFAHQDDEMELASDVERIYPEDNLDIDIDLGDEASRIGTDDYMHDDDIQEQLAMADDDEMIDDIDYEHVDQEAMMQDAQDLRDQQLFDAGLDAEGDTELVEAVIDSYEDHSHTAAPHADVSVEDSTIDYDHIGDFDIDAEHNANVHDGQVEEDALQADETTPRPEADDDETQADETSNPVVATAWKPTSPLDPINDHDAQALPPQSVANMPATELYGEEASVETHEVDEEEDADAVTPALESEHLHVPTDALHSNEEVQSRSLDPQRPPVIILFQDSELYLFSSEEAEATTCLLEDASLLHANLQELLSMCRTVLSDHVDEEEILEIEIAELGLSLNESSIDATVFTLADVVDTFVQLSLNDGSDATIPLYLTLSTRTRFSTRMQALGEAVAAGKGLSQMNIESVFEEYESEQIVNDQEHSEVAHTEDALAQEEGMPRHEESSDEVSTHKDALTITDTDDTNEAHLLADYAPAEEVDEHEIVNGPEDPIMGSASAVDDTVNVPKPHNSDLEEMEETNLQDDDIESPSTEAAQSNPSTHDDGILDLEEEREDDQDDLEDIPAVDEALEEVDNENHVQVESHTDGLSDLEDDFDDNLDGDDSVKEAEDHIETTNTSVSVPELDVPSSKRVRPADEDNIDVPAKKQQLASHHTQSHSGTTTET